MSRFFDLVSNAARNMQAYQPATPPRASVAVAEPRLARLDSNENPYGPSLRAMEAMRAALTAGHCYPDDDCAE